jgi:hypothetical protein
MNCTAMAKTTKDFLWDAERLATFSNVNGPREAKYFRQKHTDFIPPYFWKDTIPAVLDDPIPEEDPIPGLYGTDVSGMLAAMGLKSAPKSVPFWWWFKQRIRMAWQHGFPLEMCVKLISSSSRPVGFVQVWPYQRALMFLGCEPWRARFCGQCGTRLVADKPARRFCSGRCSGEARRVSRAFSWKKHGKEWRTRHESKLGSVNRRPKRPLRG